MNMMSLKPCQHTRIFFGGQDSGKELLAYSVIPRTVGDASFVGHYKLASVIFHERSSEWYATYSATDSIPGVESAMFQEALLFGKLISIASSLEYAWYRYHETKRPLFFESQELDLVAEPFFRLVFCVAMHSQNCQRREKKNLAHASQVDLFNLFKAGML